MHHLLAGDPFDIVILDPPYALCQERVRGLLDVLARAGLLAQQSLISYEYAAAGSGIPDGSILGAAGADVSDDDGAYDLARGTGEDEGEPVRVGANTGSWDCATGVLTAAPLTLCLVQHKVYGTTCLDYYLCKAYTIDNHC
jgi:hypothetical protein